MTTLWSFEHLIMQVIQHVYKLISLILLGIGFCFLLVILLIIIKLAYSFLENMILHWVDNILDSCSEYKIYIMKIQWGKRQVQCSNYYEN